VFTRAQHSVQFGSCIRHFTYYFLSHELFRIRIMYMYWARIMMDSIHIHADWVLNFCLIVFLSKKRFIIEDISNAYSIAAYTFYVAKNVWMQQFYFVATSYCHNSILYRYILLLPKMTNAIVVNNIEQYVVATSFFLLRTTFWLQK